MNMNMNMKQINFIAERQQGIVMSVLPRFFGENFGHFFAFNQTRTYVYKECIFVTNQIFS